MKFATFALLPVAALASGAMELTKENFASAMSGKNAFVKFLAPYVSICDKEIYTRLVENDPPSQANHCSAQPNPAVGEAIASQWLQHGTS